MSLCVCVYLWVDVGRRREHLVLRSFSRGWVTAPRGERICAQEVGWDGHEVGCEGAPLPAALVSASISG